MTVHGVLQLLLKLRRHRSYSVFMIHNQTNSDRVITDLQKSLAWMDIVLANLSEGVLVVGNDLTVLFANDAIGKMLGTSRIFILGTKVWVSLPLSTQDNKICTKNWFFNTLKSKNTASKNGVYLLLGRDNTITLYITFEYIQKLQQTIIVVKDITKQKLDEEMLARETAYVRLHQQTAGAANESSTIDQAMSTCLKLICTHSSWELGQVFLRNKEEPDSLKLIDSWYSNNPQKFKSFRKVTETTLFAKGKGLPGIVFKTSKPLWITDIKKAKEFIRRKEAEKSRLQAGFAFPILINKKVVGVLEFFSSTPTEPDRNFVNVMANIGAQLGRVIERNDAKEEYIRLAQEKAARKAAEAAQERIQLSEIRYRTMIEQSPLSIQILSPDGITVQVNKAWERLWGITLKDLKNYNILQDQQLVENNIMQYIRKGFEGTPSLIPPIRYEPEKTIEHISPIPHRWVQAYIYPIKNKKVIQEVVLIHQDITEIKELERQKDDFLGIASHELKTPVTSIKAYGQALQAIFKKRGDQVAAEQLGKMDAQINKLTSLISDLLDVTKIQSGRLEFHQSYFDFNSFVEEVTTELQHITEKHKLILKLSKTKTIYGDRHRLGQVITNLISNAIKYSPHSHDIMIHSESDEKTITLRVQDFGIGIPKDKQDKVFEQFFRVSGPKQYTFPGLGLGLYISSEIIKRQGGKIWVNSAEGKGSTFCFSLPIRKQDNRNQKNILSEEEIKHE